MSMIRQSFSLLTRTAQRSACSTGSATSAASATIARRAYARHYSEASTSQSVSESEGAEAASSAKPQADSKAANASAPEDAGKKELEKKNKEIAELKDNWLRSRAELDNFQKRTEKEKQSMKDFAIQQFAKDLINDLDTLHLAINSVPSERRAVQAVAEAAEKDDAGHLADLFTGVELTAKQLEKTLGRYGVSAFDPTGDKFDPNRHEALYQAPVAGKDVGTVLACSKKGWMLKDRVLRAAQVGIVSESG